MKIFRQTNRITILGVVLLALSGASFMATISLPPRTSGGLFILNYSMVLIYYVVLVVHNFSENKRRISQGPIEHTVLLALIWFVSCYALNREMNIFYNSTNWLSVWIIISCGALLTVALYKTMPNTLRYVLFFFLGASVVLFAYYALYLLPLYLLSVVALIAVGISSHTYVPLVLTIITVSIIVKAARHDRKIIPVAVAGFMLPVVICTVFLIKWNSTNREVNKVLNQNSLNDAKVPAWVSVSQHIGKSFFTERMLKAGLVYHEATLGGDNVFWDMPGMNYNEPQQHDPLVVIATAFFGRPNLDEQERIKILRSMYDSRHYAQERLWTGDELETTSVISNVKLFPEYRMAYTEKTLTIRNNARYNWNNGEAIYTFHLSPGSVVSSLSLWINGEEAKSRLTTKAKVDSAYHAIVGVERRDPSVVHWQEGNTITVRVFPCPVNENRKFRIGITSPLQKQGERLVYQNPYFEGPEAIGALETMQLSFSEKPQELHMPEDFALSSTDVYRADRAYQPGWEISCKAPALATPVFAFADTAYQVKEYQPQYESFTPETVYLDLNSAWTKAELQRIYHSLKARPVFVYDEKLIRLTENNLDDVYKSMSAQNFSLFPVNVVANSGSALIISKSDHTAPNLNDLKDSEFAKGLSSYLKTSKNIRFYNIGYELTPYLKALKELRVFNYANGNMDNLSAMLDKHQFIRNQENDSTVVIGEAQMIIQKTGGGKTQAAPDHLLRLFAYNDIMKKVGANYFSNNFVQADVIAEANTGYVVSPVSSMIVLETTNDYERFGIAENKNSLANASMKSSGSVPEPQEWVLIIMAALVACWLFFKHKVNTQTV